MERDTKTPPIRTGVMVAFLLIVPLSLLTVGFLAFSSPGNVNELPEYTNATKTVHAGVNDSFVIVLESNPTTGYQWHIANGLNSSVLVWMGTEYRPPSSDALGASEHEAYTFKAIGKGTAAISFNYSRSWESVPPLVTENFTVVVG